MEPAIQEQNPLLQYVDIALRRKWLIILPFCLAVAVSIVLCAKLPPVYRSETTILVEPQQVPENFVQSTVTGSVQDRLNTISQQILSRTRLEVVIREFNLYPELQKTAPMEELVNSMRGNIDILVEERPNPYGQSSAAAFKLAYEGTDPETVQKVTNRLAMMYIEENLRVRESLARGTKEFLDKQLQDMEQELKKREEAIQQFRQTHMGELPEQMEANLRALDQLQLQRNALMDSYRTAEDRQILLEKDLAATPQYLAGAGPDQNDLYRQLETRRQQLTALLTQYTEAYPDVVRLRKEISEIEQRIAAAGSDESQRQSQSNVPIVNPEYTRLKSQVDSNRLSMESLREQLQMIDARMRTLQQRVENTPRREQELAALTRDYQTIRQSYDSLMARKINAEVAENLETRQKSEQFRILDPPNLPQKPVKPNRLRIIAMGLALGLGAGVGLAFAVDYMDRTFKRVEDIKAALSIPVLGVIPVLRTRESVLAEKRRRLALASASVGFVATLIAGIHFFVMRIDKLASAVTGLFM